MEQIKQPKMTREYGQVQTSVLISSEFYRLCKENQIKFSEAIRVGISVLLGDKGVRDYDNTLNLFRKMNQFRLIAEEASQEVEKLKCLIENTKQEEEKNTR